ncbi:MAG TPA: response regulator [Anaerolineales bacterium]|nr:response regulator [Anaerolineales bacterium]
MTIKQDLAFVIEADADLLGICEHALRSVGFEVETFVDGKTAYTRLAVEPAPKLVLVDLELPNVSGHEITWEMWFHADNIRLITIAPDKKSAAIYKNKDGVDHVLTKPFLVEELTKFVQPYIYAAS